MPLDNKNKLRVLSLFSCCGGLDLGLEGGFQCFERQINEKMHPDWIEEDLGNGKVLLKENPFETVFANDINVAAYRTWTRFFQDKHHKNEAEYIIGSVVDLVKKAKDEDDPFAFPDADIVTGGFPCLAGNTLVLTEDGYIPITEVKAGMQVISHDGRLHSVTRFLDQGEKEVFKLTGSGFDEIIATGNHRFYCFNRKEKQAEWLDLDFLCEEVDGTPNYKKYYLGVPIIREEQLPIWNGITVALNQTTNKTIHELDMNDKTLWYFAGRYLEDGWLRKSTKKGTKRYPYTGVILCCNKNEKNELEEIFNGWLPYTLVEERTVYKFIFSRVELAAFLECFGSGAANKEVPYWVMELPNELLEQFVRGYLDADGCVITKNHEPNPLRKATSISLRLLYGMLHCIEKTMKRPCSIYVNQYYGQMEIEDRTVNTKQSYSLRFTEHDGERIQNFYDEASEYIWYKINGIEPAGIEHVYDITVADTHSFIANGCVVHNCCDFSVSGKRQGFNSTKSDTETNIDAPTPENRGMLYYWMKEVIELVEPKLFIAENVKGLTNLGDSQQIIEEDFRNTGEAGYVVIPARVIHSGDYGVAQNRERVFFFGFNKKYLSEEGLAALTSTEVPNEYDPYPVPTHDYTSKGAEGRMRFFNVSEALAGLNEPDKEEEDESQKAYSKAAFLEKGQGQTEVKLDGVGPTIRSKHHGNIEYRRLSKEHGGTHDEELASGLKERRMTVRECARIQSFPDDYEFVIKGDKTHSVSASAAYVLVGNAVPPVLAYNIARSLVEKWELWF